MIINTDMTQHWKIFHLDIITRMVLEKDSTAIVLNHEIYSEEMILGTEGKASFKTTDVIGSTAHAHLAESDLETDAHDGTKNIHVPTLPYEIWYIWDVEVPNTHWRIADVRLLATKSK